MRRFSKLSPGIQKIAFILHVLLQSEALLMNVCLYAGMRDTRVTEDSDFMLNRKGEEVCVKSFHFAETDFYWQCARAYDSELCIRCFSYTHFM
jgi:hypothetical protein